jgi:hypothetical protein
VATNLVQVFSFVGLSRRWLPLTWGFGGREPLQRVADLGRFAIAGCLSGVVGLSAGVVGASLVGRRPPLPNLVVWWGRNSVALIVIALLGVLVGEAVVRGGSIRGVLRIMLSSLVPASAGRLLETLALAVTTASLSLLIFADDAARPLAFLLLVFSVWAGIRYSPVAVTIHGLAMGVFGVSFTLAGRGPFAAGHSLYFQAVVAQAFVAMTVLTGLALAFSRAERDRANGELAEARQAADDRARLLDAVIE